MPGVFVTSADACDREAIWLSAPGTVNDGLPSLLIDDGGPWGTIQAYQPRSPVIRKPQIWVTRTDILVERWGHVRTVFGYEFALKLRWPLSSISGTAEDDQRAFDVAIHQLLMRIRGVGPNRPGGADKTHRGAFMQVAEGSDVTHTTAGIHVRYEDAEQTISSGVEFQAIVTYAADDRDFND